MLLVIKNIACCELVHPLGADTHPLQHIHLQLRIHLERQAQIGRWGAWRGGCGGALILDSQLPDAQLAQAQLALQEEEAEDDRAAYEAKLLAMREQLVQARRAAEASRQALMDKMGRVIAKLRAILPSRLHSGWSRWRDWMRGRVRGGRCHRG